MSERSSKRKTSDLELLKQECMKNPEAEKFLNDDLRAIHYETIQEGNVTKYCRKENAH